MVFQVSFVSKRYFGRFRFKARNFAHAIEIANQLLKNKQVSKTVSKVAGDL